jgi:hypothetical protein
LFLLKHYLVKFWYLILSRRELFRPAVADSNPYFADSFDKYWKVVDYYFDDMRMVSVVDYLVEASFGSVPMVSDSLVVHNLLPDNLA